MNPDTQRQDRSETKTNLNIRRANLLLCRIAVNPAKHGNIFFKYFMQLNTGIIKAFPKCWKRKQSAQRKRLQHYYEFFYLLTISMGSIERDI